MEEERTGREREDEQKKGRAEEQEGPGGIVMNHAVRGRQGGTCTVWVGGVLCVVCGVCVVCVVWCGVCGRFGGVWCVVCGVWWGGAVRCGVVYVEKCPGPRRTARGKYNFLYSSGEDTEQN